MAKPKAPSGLDAIELHPDAWERFERYVDTSVRNRPAAKLKAATSGLSPPARSVANQFDTHSFQIPAGSPQRRIFRMNFLTIVAALVAAFGFGTIVSAIISRQTVISNFRQAWIDALRKDLAEYFRALDLLNHIVGVFATDPMGMAFRKAEARADALMIFDRIRLRLNKTEKMHIELEAKLRAFLDDGLGQALADRQRIDEALQLARDVLKVEWEVTKHPWRSWWFGHPTDWSGEIF